MKTSWGQGAPTVMPDPWIPSEPYGRMREMWGVSAMNNGTIIGTNNDALLVPFLLPCDMTIYQLKFVAGNGTGNYDLGIYDDSYNRLVSSGSVAMSAGGVKTLSVADMKFRGGDTIYAALALSNTAGTILRQVLSVVQQRFYGCVMQASGLPLPSTITPATWTPAGTPLFAFGVR